VKADLPEHFRSLKVSAPWQGFHFDPPSEFAGYLMGVPVRCQPPQTSSGEMMPGPHAVVFIKKSVCVKVCQMSDHQSNKHTPLSRHLDARELLARLAEQERAKGRAGPVRNRRVQLPDQAGRPWAKELLIRALGGRYSFKFEPLTSFGLEPR
jgi:hypothetical protein